MVDNIKIIEEEHSYALECKLRTEIRENGHKIKDIKFCVNPEIKSSYGSPYSSYSCGATYYAMIIFGEE